MATLNNSAYKQLLGLIVIIISKCTELEKYKTGRTKILLTFY